MRRKEQGRIVSTQNAASRSQEYPRLVYWTLFAVTWALAIATAAAIILNYQRMATWNIGLYAVLLGGYLWAERRAHQDQEPAGARAHEPLRYLLSLAWWALIFGALMEYALWPVQQGIVTAIGVALMLLGSALRVWSVRTLGLYYSGHIETWDGQAVIQTGPYARLRHPGYAGNILQVVGLPLVVNAYLALILSGVLIGLFIRRLLWEEAWLSQNLAGYSDYQRHTWRLFPGVW